MRLGLQKKGLQSYWNTNPEVLRVVDVQRDKEEGEVLWPRVSQDGRFSVELERACGECWKYKGCCSAYVFCWFLKHVSPSPNDEKIPQPPFPAVLQRIYDRGHVARLPEAAEEMCTRAHLRF